MRANPEPEEPECLCWSGGPREDCYFHGRLMAECDACGCRRPNDELVVMHTIHGEGQFCERCRSSGDSA